MLHLALSWRFIESNVVLMKFVFIVSFILIHQTLCQASPASKVYEQYCVVCHQNGLMGAPKFQSKKDWDARKKDKKALILSAMKGLNAMPAMGTCYECSEEDISAAIDYMVPKHE